MIKFKTLHKILVRERCNTEGLDGNLLQNIVLKDFCSIFRLEGVFRDTKVLGRIPVCFRDKLEKLSLKPQGDWTIFQF